MSVSLDHRVFRSIDLEEMEKTINGLFYWGGKRLNLVIVNCLCYYFVSQNYISLNN